VATGASFLSGASRCVRGTSGAQWDGTTLYFFESKCFRTETVSIRKIFGVRPGKPEIRKDVWRQRADRPANLLKSCSGGVVFHGMEPHRVDGFIMRPGSSLGSIGSLCLIPRPAPGLKHCILCHVPPSPFCLLLPAKIADCTATVLLLLNRPDQGQIQIKAALCAGLSLLAPADPRVPRRRGPPWASRPRWCGGCTQTTPKRRRLSTLPPGGPAVCGRPRAGRPLSAQAPLAAAGQPWLSMATPGAHPGIPWLGDGEGPGSPHTTVAVAQTARASVAASPWNSVGCCPGPRAQFRLRGQVLALPAKVGTIGEGTALANLSPGAVALWGWPYPGASVGSHGGLSSGVGRRYPAGLSTSAACAFA